MSAMTIRRPARTRGWSSASTTRTVIWHCLLRHGQPGRHPEAAFRTRPGGEVAVQQADPLAHAEEAVAGAAVLARRARRRAISMDSSSSR